MSFSMDTERQNKFSFLDVEVTCEQGFLHSVYKFGMIYALVYICFCINCDWTKFHTELNFLKKAFRKDDYTKNFIEKCFKKFLDNTPLPRPC